ncbi:hypothetical protein AV530_018724 [Patagioenas fasciata monilis]|uniref:Uncharacterized protein n=1 Tax=Patagioenas fasciata monilis TaxID=372326 RepID=A0A1V4JJA3_PATFA|nr:hypothetical protein AV530_018724 [Patagioenas fasciata monilis]
MESKARQAWDYVQKQQRCQNNRGAEPCQSREQLGIFDEDFCIGNSWSCLISRKSRAYTWSRTFLLYVIYSLDVGDYATERWITVQSPPGSLKGMKDPVHR